MRSKGYSCGRVGAAAAGASVADTVASKHQARWGGSPHLKMTDFGVAYKVSVWGLNPEMLILINVSVSEKGGFLGTG